MRKYLTPAVRRAVYTLLAALGAVVIGFGLMDPADVERLIALGMAVLGLLMAAFNVPSEDPPAVEGDHFVDNDGDGVPDLK